MLLFLLGVVVVGRYLARAPTGTATNVIVIVIGNENEKGQRRRLLLRFHRRPRRGASSLRFRRLSLPPPARVSLVLGCWFGLRATPGLLGSRRADIGVRAMWLLLALPRLFCRNSPLLYRLPHLGLGEEVKDRDARIGVETEGANGQNSLCRRVEMPRQRVVKVHVLCVETLTMLVAVKLNSRPSARTGAVGDGRVIGGSGGLWLLRRRRSRRFLGPCSRRLSDGVGWVEGRSV